MNDSNPAPNPMEVDLLLLNAHVLTLDDEDNRFPKGAVAVQGEKIVAVGPSDTVSARFKARKTLDVTGCVVLPGLINSHTHASMTLFRGLADDLPLMDWLQNHIFPAEQKLTEEWVYRGALLACAEMIRSGTTTFCDMYLFEHKVAEAAKHAGMRALVGEVLYDFPSPNYGPWEKGLEYTESLIRQWDEDPLVRIAIEPHALYTCSPELLKKCFELGEKYDVPVITHLSESRSEVDQVRERYGCSPVMHLENLGLLSSRLIADHCVVLDEKDMELLAARSIRVVHDPESNMKLASGIAPVPGLLSMGIPVSLGTDGCASNNDLDMFGEMGTCARIHKVAALDPTVMPALTVLHMATRMGAKVLGLEGQVGELSPGHLADIIVVDFQKPHLTPVYDPVSHLVYAVRGADVLHSIIHGHVVMENRELKTLDFQEIADHAKQFARLTKP